MKILASFCVFVAVVTAGVILGIALYIAIVTPTPSTTYNCALCADQGVTCTLEGK